MCWETRAENSATLKLQSGEMNASESMSHPNAQAAASRFAKPSEWAKLKCAAANASKAAMRTGSKFQ
jgi:hypothetical protein